MIVTVTGDTERLTRKAIIEENITVIARMNPYTDWVKIRLGH